MCQTSTIPKYLLAINERLIIKDGQCFCITAAASSTNINTSPQEQISEGVERASMKRAPTCSARSHAASNARSLKGKGAPR
jgi:hypothetical protein